METNDQVEVVRDPIRASFFTFIKLFVIGLILTVFIIVSTFFAVMAFGKVLGVIWFLLLVVVVIVAGVAMFADYDREVERNIRLERRGY